MNYILDNILIAIDEYHKTIKKPHIQCNIQNMTYEDKRGIFYNCLRRNASWFYGISIADLTCYFDEKGYITKYDLMKPIHPFSHLYEERIVFKNYGSHKIYPTKELNELSIIINSVYGNTRSTTGTR